MLPNPHRRRGRRGHRSVKKSHTQPKPAADATLCASAAGLHFFKSRAQLSGMMRRDVFMAMLGRHFWRWLWKLGVIVLVLAAARSSLGDWSEVPCKSMVPTILPGDRIYVNKLAYDLKLPFTTTHLMTWGEPKRGDVVTLLSPADGVLLVKRVVAVPGDTIEGRDGERMPPGKFYVMGDNRDHSVDSRSFGLVDRRQVLGRVVGVIVSVDPDRRLGLRRGRFFLKMK
jgi:signal peptidase I